MAKKPHHEEHANHEAWAIPYGDLITLLLAFFVVMYAVSSINEGKYRVLSDALKAAFGGPPKSLKPIQIGRKESEGAGGFGALTLPLPRPKPQAGPELHRVEAIPPQIHLLLPQRNELAGVGGQEQQLQHMARDIEQALSRLIRQNLVIVRRSAQWLEVEIKTDILFASGSALVSPEAQPTLAQIAGILKPFPQRIRIEGYTDNVPIRTAQFPSNWELSGARASSVVRAFVERGIDPRRLSVLGFGEFRPVADNSTPDGRNRNRRVVIVVLANPPAGTEAPDRTGNPR